MFVNDMNLNIIKKIIEILIINISLIFFYHTYVSAKPLNFKLGGKIEEYFLYNKIENKYSEVVLVGHNPAYTEISNYFSENKILNLPTARWFSLRFDTNHWSNIFDLKPLSYINNLKSGT